MGIVDGGVEAGRAEIAAVCRQLAADGLVLGTAGNVSVRVGELVAVTATGTRFAELTPAQVSVVDLAGRLRGSWRPPPSSGCTWSCTAGIRRARSCTPTRRWPSRWPVCWMSLR